MKASPVQKEGRFAVEFDTLVKTRPLKKLPAIHGCLIM
jgi:hypothetical protein